MKKVPDGLKENLLNFLFWVVFSLIVFYGLLFLE